MRCLLLNEPGVVLSQFLFSAYISGLFTGCPCVLCKYFDDSALSEAVLKNDDVQSFRATYLLCVFLHELV